MRRDRGTMRVTMAVDNNKTKLLIPTRHLLLHLLCDSEISDLRADS